MAWATHRGAKRYYSRSVRVGRKVVRQYIGAGPLADVAASLDELRRHERRERDQLWEKAVATWEQAERSAVRLGALGLLLARATLLVDGCRRHDRGEWRRRRDHGRGEGG